MAIANAKGLLKSLSKNATNATSVLDDMCSVIAYDLPSECQCQAGGNGQFEVQCQVDFMDVDEIGLTGVGLNLFLDPNTAAIGTY